MHRINTTRNNFIQRLRSSEKKYHINNAGPSPINTPATPSLMPNKNDLKTIYVGVLFSPFLLAL